MTQQFSKRDGTINIPTCCSIDHPICWSYWNNTTRTILASDVSALSDNLILEDRPNLVQASDMKPSYEGEAVEVDRTWVLALFFMLTGIHWPLVGAWPQEAIHVKMCGVRNNQYYNIPDVSRYAGQNNPQSKSEWDSMKFEGAISNLEGVGNQYLHVKPW